ncbi:MAG: SUMF1/EgtB/PvdO family nonheme iron enzyme [Thermodesulfobacteriota bacterium]
MKIAWILIPILTLLFAGCSKPPEEAKTTEKKPAAAKVAPQKSPEDTLKDMVLIPAGKFFMGSSKDIEDDNFFDYGFVQPFYADASPMIEVHLDAYHIDKYEVTHEAYQKFLIATGRKSPGGWRGSSYRQGRERRPVGGINWFEATEYCNWMNKRLPTEAEWEKAARGADKREYPWGNDYDNTKANVSLVSEEVRDTVDVDAYPEGKSPYGVYNMVGNVWEWTDSWYQPYSGAVYESEKFGENDRVVRGNSSNAIAHFYNEEHHDIVSQYSKTYFRFPVRPDYHVGDIGFRCVK